MTHHPVFWVSGAMETVLPSATVTGKSAQWSDGGDVSRHTQVLEFEDALCCDGRLSRLLLLFSR